MALRALLQHVVADCGGSLHRRLDVAGLHDLPALFGVVSPHAREAVGLQLDSHLELVRFRPRARALLGLLHPRQNPEQVLHVMADLVRDHIGLRELAGLAAAAAEAPFEVAKERRVEIDLAARWTIERTHGALRRTASRARPA